MQIFNKQEGKKEEIFLSQLNCYDMYIYIESAVDTASPFNLHRFIVEKKGCSIKHAQISGVQTAVRCNAANSTTHRGPLSFIVRHVENEKEREREGLSRVGYKFHGVQRDSNVYRGDRRVLFHHLDTNGKLTS